MAQTRFSCLFLLLVAFSWPTFAASPDLDDYYRQRGQDPAAARKTLENVIESNPRDVTARLEMAYLLLNAQDVPGAIAQLEHAQQLDPQNEQVRLQLGYAYQAGGKNTQARRIFSGSSALPGACQALADLASRRFNVFPNPYFGDLYLNPVYLSRFDDHIFYGQARAGAVFGTRAQLETYVGGRVTDDSESAGGRTPEILSDNAAIFAVGARYHPFANFPLSVYGEAGRAYDLIDRNRDRWRDDFRAGLSYFDQWAPAAQCGPAWRFPLRRASSLYADLSVYSRYDRNWIGYVQWREGLRLLEKGRMATDGFLYAGGAMDANDDYFNNVVEYGAGAALTPDIAWPLTLRYTAVRGTYLKTSGALLNPHPREYTDHRWDATVYLRF